MARAVKQNATGMYNKASQRVKPLTTPVRCRANSAHVRQSRPDSGLVWSHVSGTAFQIFVICSLVARWLIRVRLHLLDQFSSLDQLYPTVGLELKPFRDFRIDRLRGEGHKTRRCRRVTYPESHITKYTRYTKIRLPKGETLLRLGGVEVP